MATQVQFRRGTTGETALFTGAVGEVTVDITKDTCVVHDGFTQGGFPLMREDGTNMALSSGSLSSCALKFAADPNTGLINPASDQLVFVTGGVARMTLDSSGGATFSNNVIMAGSLNVGAWGGTTVTHGYGGTGHTSYSPGQLLIGKADGSLAKATLTASTGVTITNGDGTITISSVGLGGTVTAVTASTPLASTGGTTPNITIQDGTTTQKGAVQLEDSTSSTSTTTAATPNAVKGAYDLANAALPKSGGTMTGAILGDDSTSPATPGYAFDGDANTGMVRLGADELGLVTGGATRLSIDATGNVNIAGDLTVQGATTTIDSTTVLIEDKNIELGVVGTPTDTTADGGGITLRGTTNKTIEWLNSTGAWTLSEHLNIASTKEYRIAGVKVLDATSLGSAVVSSSLTSLGTITTGVWQGSAIGTGYGGTGQTTYTDGQLLIGNSTGNTLTKSTLTAGSGVTITNGAGTITISATGMGGTVTAVTATSPLASTGGTTPDISIQDGTTAQKGAVQLEDSTSSTSTTKAATPNAVKSAYDLANAALPKAGGTLTGDLTLNAQSDLRFADADSSNWVAFQAPATIASNVTWTLPDADGTSGQVLRTNGFGVLSWGAGGGGGASVTTSDTAPVSPNHGDLWYDSVGGRTYVYYGDVDSSQWVDIAPQGLVSVVTSDTAPASPLDGAFWYDSSVGRTYIYYNDGTTSQWVDSSPQATGPQSLISVGNTTAEVVDTGSDGRFTVTTEGVERLRVDSSGNTGFGTITPGSRVDVKGTLRLSGSSSGYVGLAPAAAAGSTTYTLPSADGTSGQVLSTNGTGTLSWSTPAVGFSRSKAYFYSGF